MLNLTDENSFSHLLSVSLKSIGRLNWKLLIFCRHNASFEIRISKVQDFQTFADAGLYRSHQKPADQYLQFFHPNCKLVVLTLKAPITTAADDKFCNIFPSFQQKSSRRFSWNIMPYLLFLKKQQNLKLSSAANYRWRFKGILGQVWYLIVSIPDLCTLTFFNEIQLPAYIV